MRNRSACSQVRGVVDVHRRAVVALLLARLDDDEPPVGATGPGDDSHSGVANSGPEP